MAQSVPDPTALFREFLGQWERAVNENVGEAMKSEEFARAMGAATSASSAAQGKTHEMMERALAAANMPSRAEVADLSGRLARIEEQLTRIEARLDGTHRPPEPRLRPSRTRKPPQAA